MELGLLGRRAQEDLISIDDRMDLVCKECFAKAKLAMHLELKITNYQAQYVTFYVEGSAEFNIHAIMSPSWGSEGEKHLRTVTQAPSNSLLVCRPTIPTTYYLLPTTYYLLPTTYYLLPTAYCLLPTTYYLMLPATCYLLPGSTCYLLPATCYLLPTAYYLLPTTFYLLHATYYLLPTTY